MARTSCEVCNVWLHAIVKHVTLRKLVCAKEHNCTGERPQERREPAAIQSSSYSLLSENCIVRRAEGGVFRRHMRVALLPRLDRIKRVHEHVTSGSSEATGDHGLGEGGRSISIFPRAADSSGDSVSYMDVGLAALIMVDFVGHYAAAAYDVLRKLTLEGRAIAAWLTRTSGRKALRREGVCAGTGWEMPN